MYRKDTGYAYMMMSSREPPFGIGIVAAFALRYLLSEAVRERVRQVVRLSTPPTSSGVPAEFDSRLDMFGIA